MTLPTHSPAEVLKISPEAMEIANSYLQTNDINQVANDLDISVDLVNQYLEKKEVKSYIDNVFFNVGFNNRFKMRAAMDAIIQKKFQELEESSMGSNKDITELLALSHKITMDHMTHLTNQEKTAAANIKSQVNVQINDGFADGSKYGALMQKLLNGGV